MDDQTLQTILLGGLGGALAAQSMEILRDGSQHRRRVRGAARVLRTEIIANSGVVATALQLGTIPKGAPWVFRNDRFERQIDVLIGELSRDDTATLLAFDAMHVSVESVLKAMQAGTANPKDVKWLEETWAPIADMCQSMMDFKGGRWWEPIKQRKAWKQLKQRRNEFEEAASNPS